jgi:hypothetical protein
MIFHRSTILSGAFAVKLLRVVGGTVFLACLLVPACHRHPRLDDRVQEVSLNDAQRTQALTAMGRLRDQFNRGACQSIYDAAGAGFRSQPSEDWLRECARLQDELGSWTDFRAKETEGFGKQQIIVFIYGLAVFQKENQQFEINWILSEEGARLHAIRFRKSESQDWIEFPRFPGHRWQDLPIKAPKSGLDS